MKKKFKNLPLYDMNVDGIGGVEIMSLVDNPAVEKNFLKFDNQKPLKFSKDEDKHIITGVLMLADTPIYRNNKEFGEHYVVFSKQCIGEIVNKFFKEGNTSNVNLQHAKDTEGINMFESYIVNKERGICPKEFSDVPNGSWIGSYHIDNISLWNEIKNSGTLNGFSIEGLFGYNLEEEEDTEDSDFYSNLLAIINE